MVVPIPSRHSYSKRIKQAFWMNGAEIQQTAERNRYEFASEGWDFHQVLEEEDMYVDMDGQLVHPVWVENDEDEDEVEYDTNNNQLFVHTTTTTIEEDEIMEDAWIDIPTPALKRTDSGVFGLQALGEQLCSE
jgi:hypothetical protein